MKLCEGCVGAIKKAVGVGTKDYVGVITVRVFQLDDGDEQHATMNEYDLVPAAACEFPVHSALNAITEVAVRSGGDFPK